MTGSHTTYYPNLPPKPRTAHPAKALTETTALSPAKVPIAQFKAPDKRQARPRLPKPKPMHHKPPFPWILVLDEPTAEIHPAKISALFVDWIDGQKKSKKRLAMDVSFTSRINVSPLPPRFILYGVAKLPMQESLAIVRNLAQHYFSALPLKHMQLLFAGNQPEHIQPGCSP